MFTPRLLSTIDECLTISPTSRIASCEALITRLGADISEGTASGQPSQSALEVTGVSVVDSALKQTAPRRRTRRYRWVAPGLLALVVLTAWFMNDFWPFSGRGPDESPSAFDGALTSELGDESPPRSRPTPTSPLVLYDTNRNGVISCDEARAAGIVPVRRGHPAYLFMVDLDNDGIVCESGGHRPTDGQTPQVPGRGLDEPPSGSAGGLASEPGDESPPSVPPRPGPLAQYDSNGNGVISCAEARAARIAPVRRGHPAYSFMVDSDNDGIVCEAGGHRSTDGQTVRGPQPGTFTRGFHADIVLQVQGTPSSIDTYESLGYETWRYGLSSINIELGTRRVTEWDNLGGNLKVK